jgi:hypothetical protein
MGTYSLTEFHKHLSPKVRGLDRAKAYLAAAFTGKAADVIVVLYYLLLKRSARLPLFDVLCSRYATSASRFFARILGLKTP